MQTRTRFLLYSEAYEGWLNRLADKHTQDIFSALYFNTAEQAEHWLETYDKAPKDKENYVIQETLTEMGVVKNVRNDDRVAETFPR